MPGGGFLSNELPQWQLRRWVRQALLAESAEVTTGAMLLLQGQCSIIARATWLWPPISHVVWCECRSPARFRRQCCLC
jgi:hypothetical protein